jgi:flagellin
VARKGPNLSLRSGQNAIKAITVWRTVRAQSASFVKEHTMSSILTNSSSMVALQTLKGINSNLSKTQDEISTGKSVASAKDNAAVWAISKVMEADVKGFKGISDSLSLGESTVAVARQAAETVTDLLTKVKGKIVAAQEDNVDGAKIQTDIVALRDQITSVVNAAQFNGLNLINGSVTTTNANGATGINVLSSLDRDASGGVTASSIGVDANNLAQTAGGGLAALATVDVTTNAAGALAGIEAMIQTAVSASASFGSVETRIDIQSSFVGKLTDSLKAGIGSLVDADMEEASARLQALQVQQQLGVQSLSIANQAPQNILALFR